MAEQKAAGFGVLVVVFGSGGGEKGGFLRAAQLGKLLEGAERQGPGSRAGAEARLSHGQALGRLQAGTEFTCREEKHPTSPGGS